ncbi:MAG: HesA/MoeB/ThiF family protein [Candidatus Micrarchaeota archaeon]
MLVNRYIRQIKLLGEKDHAKLSNLTVGIIGCGGLGSNSALLCAQLGVKKLILMDRDKVSQTDFNRQQFSESDLGRAKVEALKEKIGKTNSNVLVEAHFEQFGEGKSKGAFRNANVILDGTDNFSTRVAINRFCLQNKIPWIFASALKFEGMLSTILPLKSACFECWAIRPKNELSCEDAGIMNTAVAAIAALQVQELINLICFNKPNYANKLLRVDLRSGLFESIALERSTKCPTCSKKR